MFRVVVGLTLIFCVGALPVWSQENVAAHGAVAATVTNKAELSVKLLQVADGLKAELFAADPLLFNPVAFAIDEQGRFFVSETHRYKDSIFDIWAADQRWKDADAAFRSVEDRAAFLAREFATNLNHLTKDSEVIRLVQDRDDDGRAETTSVFADGFNRTVSGTAAGILAHEGELWFTCIPDLWHFTYDESGHATSREVLHTGYGVHIGVSGHDLHGLTPGPDGKIYFSVGDRGARVKTKEGGELNYPDTGAVFRCNRDGTELEVFAIGLRNPQELAFDHLGNLWAHDNDTAGEDKSRVLHIVEGGDYGWRYSYQFMEGFGPWVREKVWEGNIDDVLPPAGYGAQGPAGLAYYPGVGLPEKYRRHFIACDFPQGVWAYSFNPRGASYAITEKEKFVWNFGATDAAFGPDGHLYLSDWGKSYQMPDAGRIYRVFDPAQTNNPALAELKRLLGEGMNGRPLAELGGLLGHADLRVRQEAQFEFARRVSEELQAGQSGAVAGASATGDEATKTLHEIAAGATNQTARIHAILALAQVPRHSVRFGEANINVGNWIIQPLTRLVSDSDAEIRAQVSRAFGEWRYRDATVWLVRLLRDESPRVRFHAAMSLGKLGNRAAAPQLINMLRQNADHDAFLTHAGVWALVNLGDMEIIQTAARDESLAVRRAALLCLRRMERPEIAEFIKAANTSDEAEARLVVEAARAINDVPINVAMPELAALLPVITLRSKTAVGLGNWPALQSGQLIRRAINANFRLGTATNAQALAEFALGSADADDELRVEALEALANWARPPGRDRVVGLWRPLPERDPTPVRELLRRKLEWAFTTRQEPVVVAAINSAGKLEIKEAAPMILTLYRKPESGVAVRVAALKALAALDEERLAEAVKLALADADKSIRREGIKYIERLNRLDTAELLETMLADETDLRISQEIYAALGGLKDSNADTVLVRQLEHLLAGKIKSALQLDLIEAARRRESPAVREALARYEVSLDSTDPLAPHRVLLAGGDAALGKKIFHENDAVGCLRCHAIKGKGGLVGPDLAGIATKQTREYLLESLLFPNKTTAPGYENVVITLASGVNVAGQVQKESADELLVNSQEDGVVTVKKSDITACVKGLSAMPEGLEKLLTRQDLRNLIEYLAGLK